MPACEPIKIGCCEVVRYNEHNPHEYVTKLAAMDEKQLFDACKDTIWFSAYAANRPSSDFHWMCDATYAECKKRGREDIYNKAHDVVSRNI